MPHVIIKLWPGKTERQKEQLAEKIVQDVVDVLKCGESSVSLAFEEIDADNWAAEVYQPEIKAKWDILSKKPGYTM